MNEPGTQANMKGTRRRAGVQHEEGAPEAQRRPFWEVMSGHRCECIRAYIRIHAAQKTAWEGLGKSNKALLLGNLSKLFQVNSFHFFLKCLSPQALQVHKYVCLFCLANSIPIVYYMTMLFVVSSNETYII